MGHRQKPCRPLVPIGVLLDGAGSSLDGQIDNPGTSRWIARCISKVYGKVNAIGSGDKVNRSSIEYDVTCNSRMA